MITKIFRKASYHAHIRTATYTCKKKPEITLVHGCYIHQMQMYSG